MTQENAPGEGTQQLNILRIYLKDVSFEAPNSPSVFIEAFNPQVNVQLTTSAATLDENLYEVVLHVSVSAAQDGKTGFLVELQQAGIFHVQGYSEAEVKLTIEAACPKVLFPFAREAVSDLVTKGGFPQLLLAPVDFSQVVQHTLAGANKQAASE